MLILKAENICVELNGKEILSNASIEIHQGEHLALIGQNGIGKTTFLKAILGELPLAGGTISNRTKAEDWGWMAQSPYVPEGMTTRAFVEGEAPDRSQLRMELQSLGHNLDTGQDTIDAYNHALQAYLDLDGYDWELTIEKQMTRCGLPEPLWELPFSNLSGGQKTRAQLARVLAKGAKFLIFDEPTNHLDIETMDWLAKWIKGYQGAVLIVSHDRQFIDQVAQFTYEITEEGTKRYTGGYAAYKKQKEHERKAQESLYNKQEHEKKQLMEAIQTYTQWFNKAHHAASERDPFAKKRANKNMTRFKAKEKALERLEANRVQKPKEESKLSVTFDEGTFSSSIMASFKAIRFSYGEKVIVDGASFFLEKGDRLAIVGRNGSGKTTLLKLLAGNLQPAQGEITRHPKLKIGYFMQELEALPLDDSILDYILSIPNMTQSEARTILACFLFPKEAVFKRIGDLSMGEKCRVAFVKLYFSQANLLVLDEPTNYLDIVTREQIEEALQAYPGAIVVVSHDHYLLKRVANRVLSLDKGFDYFPGNYTEWQASTAVRDQNLELENEKRRLELLYTQLIAEELPDDENLKQEQLDKLRKVKQKLRQLEG
ncbi:MAG TPA: ABC-F type ribosomal protection protein [Candidatus Angelobacter sp.]|nr:ABC-F type ribosomal protection protein [Candidatus Angelobacter sp.]